MRALHRTRMQAHRVAAAAACLVLLAAAPAGGREAARAGFGADAPVVEVVGAYVDLHAGPGRGYPVHHIAARGERIALLKRRTDWVRVRTASGREGWVGVDALERTRGPDGARPRFRPASLEDFRQRRLETGFATGQFDGDPIVSVRLGYRLAETVGIELSAGQVAGTFSGSRLYQAGLMFMPFAGQRISPFVTLGVGRFSNRDRPSLVGGDERLSATAASAGGGVRGYLTRNFVLRADYRHYLSLTELERNDTFNAWTVGLSFFF